MIYQVLVRVPLSDDRWEQVGDLTKSANVATTAVNELRAGGKEARIQMLTRSQAAELQGGV